MFNIFVYSNSTRSTPPKAFLSCITCWKLWSDWLILIICFGGTKKLCKNILWFNFHQLHSRLPLIDNGSCILNFFFLISLVKVDDPSSLFRGKEHGAHERQGVNVFMHKGRGLVDFFKWGVRSVSFRPIGSTFAFDNWILIPSYFQILNKVFVCKFFEILSLLL